MRDGEGREREEEDLIKKMVDAIKIHRPIDPFIQFEGGMTWNTGCWERKERGGGREGGCRGEERGGERTLTSERLIEKRKEERERWRGEREKRKREREREK
jgi:hypothetical protein